MFSNRKELERQKRILQFIKDDGCDMCIDDLMSGRITPEDLETEEYQKIAIAKMGFERIYLCKHHLFQVGKKLNEFLNNNNITNNCSNQPTIPNNTKHILPFPIYEEIDKTRDEIESELMLRRLCKVNCCSRCLTEASCLRELDSPERAPVYSLYIGGRRINFCRKHLIEFSKSIDNFIAENYPEEITSIKK